MTRRHPNGDPLVRGETPPDYTIEALEFWKAKGWITENEYGCWIWRGGLVMTGKTNDAHHTYSLAYLETSTRYGFINLRTGKGMRVHRWVYECIHGEGALEGLTLDHSPHLTLGIPLNTLCCNPDHLEVVSNLVNIKRQTLMFRLQEKAVKGTITGEEMDKLLSMETERDIYG